MHVKEEALIEFSNVNKSFRKKIVLDSINLKIKRGEIFALIGKSGSGKSTLLNLLLGIYSPDSGKIIFKGKDVTGNSKYIRQIVGLTTQENSFYDKLSVYENMRYYSNLYRIKTKYADAHIDTLLKSVGLETSKDSLAENLSGGMKRRLDFAISILHDPELLILDEPTTGLDPLLVKQFWEIVKKVNEEGKTIIVISHIFSELEENATDACILSSGKIAKAIKINEKTNLLKELTDLP
jgi:ABC-2 type transport system ATP-binding protein